MIKPRSLRRELLNRLVIPLVFFVIIDTMLTYFLTLYYVDQAYDRWLLDSAKSLMQEIKVTGSKAVVELPPAALAIFKWDESDKTYFKIITDAGNILAGDEFVPDYLGQPTDWSKPVFFRSDMNGEMVRVVSMMIERPDSSEKIMINVAETLNKRRTMMRDIFLADLIPQLILILLTASYLFTGLKKGLQPLHALADAIAERSPKDLEPIPETHVFLEVRTLTNTINDLFRQLSAAISSQQRFITNAAHQLRTPLAGLKLQAERAMRESNLTAMKPALEKIQGSADRLSHMTAQLLLLAKSEPIAGSHDWTRVDLSALARDVSIEWVPKALTRKMELSFESTREPVFIKGDRLLLGEMLANLLDNAIAYGFEKGNIVVRLHAGPNPCLTVEDDGPGMADAEINRVFERFYRIPGSRGEGCGLGLAIVKEIADLHKAEIVINSSKADRGTRFELKFPAYC